jgi:hypothetical protein
MMKNAELKTGLDLSQWEINNPANTDLYYSCDAVIEAYLKGASDGLKNEEKVIFNQFKTNLEKTQSYTIDLLQLIEQTGFTPIEAHIKFDSFDSFEVLIAVNEQDFIKDEFLTVYEAVTKLEDKVKEDVYSLAFSFIPVDGIFDEEKVVSDGYRVGIKKV